ncbi:hypothetical protein [Polaromonas sp. YR568]|uniref:hypothetical protein n=1 Tax=Polaromonas sp. YR568 TaxID=1855301 RepID=UPI000B881582|nr:hypothetical protein [Polaromonas sp. YR568]
MSWLVFLLHSLVVALGVALLWVAYQVAFRARLSLIRDRGKPIPDAHLIAGRFAVMAACMGLAVLIFAAAISLFHIRFGTWQFYLATMAGVAGMWRNILLWRHNRRSALTGRLP